MTVCLDVEKRDSVKVLKMREVYLHIYLLVQIYY